MYRAIVIQIKKKERHNQIYTHENAANITTDTVNTNANPIPLAQLVASSTAQKLGRA